MGGAGEVGGGREALSAPLQCPAQHPPRLSGEAGEIHSGTWMVAGGKRKFLVRTQPGRAWLVNQQKGESGDARQSPEDRPGPSGSLSATLSCITAGTREQE